MHGVRLAPRLRQVHGQVVHDASLTERLKFNERLGTTDLHDSLKAEPVLPEMFENATSA